MKIRFVRPLPRIDHVIPAGFVLDAPEGFAKKMIRTGRAVAVSGVDPVPTLEDTDRGAEKPRAVSPASNPFEETEDQEEESAADTAEEKPKKPARVRKGN